MDETLKLMEKWILKERKSVGRKFLLTHSNLTDSEAESALNQFLTKHADVDGLNATYQVFGQANRREFKTRPKESGEDTQKSDKSNPEKPPRLVTKSVICHESKLQSVEESFVKVYKKVIFSVQVDQLNNLQRPLNAIFSGHQAKPKTDLEDRLRIVNKDVVDNLPEIRKNKMCFDFGSVDLAELAPEEKRGPKVFIKKIVVKNDQHSLKDAFANAEKIKDEVVDVEESVSVPQKRPAPVDLDLAEKKSKKDRLDTKAKKAKPTTKPGGIEQTFKSVERPKRESPKKVEQQRPPSVNVDVGLGDDLFSTEDGGPMDIDMEPDIEVVKKPAKKRRAVVSDDEDDECQMKASGSAGASDSPGKDGENKQNQKPRAWKKELVEEEEVDEDGMTVTRTVTKLVEVEVKEENAKSGPAKPKPVLKPSNPKPVKRAPPGQPKISSFFMKK